MVRNRENKVGARGQTGAVQQWQGSRKERGKPVRELVKLGSSGVLQLDSDTVEKECPTEPLQIHTR